MFMVFLSTAMCWCYSQVRRLAATMRFSVCRCQDDNRNNTGTLRCAARSCQLSRLNHGKLRWLRLGELAAALLYGNHKRILAPRLVEIFEEVQEAKEMP
jgi:hypothetical protein